METVPVQLIGNKEGSNMVLPTQENGTKIEECRGGAHESGLRGSCWPEGAQRLGGSACCRADRPIRRGTAPALRTGVSVVHGRGVSGGGLRSPEQH